MPRATLKELYPHLMTVTETPFKTKKAALAAAAKTVALECNEE